MFAVIFYLWCKNVKLILIPFIDIFFDKIFHSYGDICIGLIGK